VSVFSLTWEGKKFHFGKGSRLALITAVLFTFSALFDKAVISYFSPILYTFLVYLFTVLFMFPFAFIHYRKGAKLPKKKTISALIFTGSLYGISAYCIYAAFLTHGPLSLISLASQLEIPITILWGIFVMKEQKRMIPKLISMALLIIGIILLK
jgi:drug/metabolite transporter (DMT)-like permease